MKSIKGNTQSHVMVQLAVMNFNDELSKQYKFRASKDDIPDLDQLVKIVEPLSHTLPFQQQTASASKQQQQRKDSTRKQSNGDSKSVPHLVDCSLCKNAYPHCIVALCLWAILQHKGKATLTAAGVVSTVLHQSRVVSHCSSNHICRQCKGRHHTGGLSSSATSHAHSHCYTSCHGQDSWCRTCTSRQGSSCRSAYQERFRSHCTDDLVLWGQEGGYPSWAGHLLWFQHGL